MSLTQNFTNNFDIFRLFLDKVVTINITTTQENDIEIKQNFKLRLPTIRELYTNSNLLTMFALFTLDDKKEFDKYTAPLTFDSMVDFCKSMIFEYGQFQETTALVTMVKEGLEFFFPDINFHNNEREIYISPGLSMTDEICNYIRYVLQLSCGEGKEDPSKMPKFADEKARRLYMAQKKAQEEIERIKAQNKKGGAKDGYMKAFIFIEYYFPNYSHEYLLNQTLAQIQWLQEYAAKALSYELNAQAYAAGNLKEGTKIVPFINL